MVKGALILMNIESIKLNDEQARYKLQTWFSPSYPIGAYTYSHGLEAAFEAGLICNVDEAVSWISEIIANGNGFSDAVFLNIAHQCVRERDFDRLLYVTEFASAFCGTAELRLESFSQGLAFLDTRQKVDPSAMLNELQDWTGGPYPYSVVCGVAAAEIGILSKHTIIAFLHGFVANLASALVRIIPLGQSDGQRIIEAMEPIILDTAEKVIDTSLDELSVSTLMVELNSMRHETQYTRLFRS